MGEQSQFRTQLSGMLQEGPPAPSRALPSERAVWWYPSSKKPLGEEGVTVAPRFKAVLMQLWHLPLQGLEQTKSDSMLGVCSATQENHQGKMGSFVSAEQG